MSQFDPTAADDRPTVTQQQEPECSASISGMCLNLSMGFSPCDTDEGECIEGGQPPREQPAAEDTCRPVEIIRVHGAAEMSDESRAALAEVIAAAKRRYLAEHPEDEQQPAAADGGTR